MTVPAAPGLPLLVHLVFHPSSTDARAMASRLHAALNADSVVQGLRIPTTFVPETVDEAPPTDVGWDDAERNFIVVLADAALSVEPAWCTFAGDLWDRCTTGQGRMFPVQLGANSYPLDERLLGTNFVRAANVAEPGRTRFVARRMVIELCRYLHGEQAGGDHARAPIRIFVSHTKLDLAIDPPVVPAIIDALKIDQPVEGWFDTGDIDAGSVFEQKIEEGVSNSSLLCVLTDNYGSREWCRREVLLGKTRDRPILVLDALSGFDVRSFPYLGNIPVMRWGSDAQAVIDCLLKETLRYLHSSKLLEQQKRPKDRTFTRPPELLTMLSADPPLSPDETVLYPDPPLGREELSVLRLITPRVTTPLERFAAVGDLTAMRIAMSTSESSNAHRFGASHQHQREFMLELARHLLIRGATLVYGGHLGDDGYTSALAELVRAHNSVPGVDPVARIVNYVGWPSPWNVDVRDKYRQTAELIRVDRPEGVPDIDVSTRDFTPEDRYAWARGMTAMRAEMARNVDARIVLGGKVAAAEVADPQGFPTVHWYSGRIPGVLEEVVTSVEVGQPVFLIAGFGGVADLVFDIVTGVDRPEMSWEYQRNAPWSDELRQKYNDLGLGWQDYPEIVAVLRDKGLAGLNPLLSVDEHRELAQSRQLPSVLANLLTGLARMR